MKKKTGFTLVELLCVLVILALLVFLVGRMIVGTVNKAKEDIDEQTKKSILNATEKWAIDNSDKFDDIEGSNLSVSVGVDVVFVVDVSSSMSNTMDGKQCTTDCRYEAAVIAINEALAVLRTNEKNRVGFVFYSGISSGNTTTTSSPAVPEKSIIGTMELTYIENVKDLETSMSSIVFYKEDGSKVVVKMFGETYTSLGVRKAMELFNSKNEEGRAPVIVLLTDGEATRGAEASESFSLTPSKYGVSPTRMPLTKVSSLNTITTEDGHTKTTYGNVDDGITYSLEHWKDAKGCMQTIEINGHKNERTVYNSCENPTYQFYPDFYNAITYNNVDNYIDEVLNFYKNGYDSSEKRNDLFINIIWDLTHTSYLAKNQLTASYQSEAYFYTIGLGVTSNHGQFMLNPNEENLNKLNLYPDIYNFMKSQKDYNYPTKAFTGKMSADELRKIFSSIATEVTEATKVTTLCITVQTLKDGGYLSKDANISDDLASDTYIIVNENEATNQYVFNIVKNETQKQECQEHLIN